MTCLIQKATAYPSSSHGPLRLQCRWLKITFPNFNSPSVAKYSRWHNVSSMYFESFESLSKITLSCKTGKRGDWHVPKQSFGSALPTRLRARAVHFACVRGLGWARGSRALNWRQTWAWKANCAWRHQNGSTLGGPQVSGEPGSPVALPSPASAKLRPQLLTSFCRSGEGETHILYCRSTLLLPAMVKALNWGGFDPPGTEPRWV